MEMENVDTWLTIEASVFPSSLYSPQSKKEGPFHLFVTVDKETALR
jgi:hypothetical protein